MTSQNNASADQSDQESNPSVWRRIVGASADSEWAEVPNMVSFAMTRSDAEEVVRLAALVKEHKLKRVALDERGPFCVFWLKGESDHIPQGVYGEDDLGLEEVDTDVGVLNVSDREFWFSTYLKHQSFAVSSERQKVSDLVEWLGEHAVATPEKASQDSPVPNAQRFMDELLASVETLEGISEQLGVETLVDLMYLQAAIVNGGSIDAFDNSSAVVEVVSALPSGVEWLQFINRESSVERLRQS